MIRSRDAIPADAVVVALVVTIVVIVVGVTLKICGSEKRTAEAPPVAERSGWLSAACPVVPDDGQKERGGGEEEEEEEEEEEDAGKNPHSATIKGVIIVRQSTEREHQGKWRTSRRCWPMSAT